MQLLKLSLSALGRPIRTGSTRGAQRGPCVLEDGGVSLKFRLNYILVMCLDEEPKYRASGKY